MTEETQFFQREVSMVEKQSALEKSLENDTIIDDSTPKITADSEYFGSDVSRNLIETATILLMNTDYLENVTSTTLLPMEQDEVDHQKDFSALSSLNQEFAKKQMGDVLKERMLETNTLDEIIEKTKYKKQQIDFLNVDVEGHDMEVLKSLTFEIYSPKLICVEEISENYLLNSTHQFLIKKGYAHLWSGSLSHIYYKLT